MPLLKIRNNETNEIMKVMWNDPNPPNDQDMEDIYAAYAAKKKTIPTHVQPTVQPPTPISGGLAGPTTPQQLQWTPPQQRRPEPTEPTLMAPTELEKKYWDKPSLYQEKPKPYEYVKAIPIIGDIAEFGRIVSKPALGKQLTEQEKDKVVTDLALYMLAMGAGGTVKEGLKTLERKVGYKLGKLFKSEKIAKAFGTTIDERLATIPKEKIVSMYKEAPDYIKSALSKSKNVQTALRESQIVKPTITPKPKPTVRPEADLFKYNKTQKNIIQKADIPKEKIPEYLMHSQADSFKVGKFAKDVNAGKLSIDKAAEKVKTDYQKLVVKPEIKPTEIKPTEKPKVIKPEVDKVESAVNKVVKALKEAKSLRKQQETIYSLERGEKLKKISKVGQLVKGEKGYYAKLRELKGKLTKVEYEGIKSKVGQEEVDTLFTTINDSDAISEWSKISAAKGLAKMFGKFGGTVPTEGEIKLLRKVFGNQLPDTLLSKRPLLAKIEEAGYQIANIPRSVMASFDLSAPFRQGAFLVGTKQFWTSFDDMFKAFGSEKSFKALQESIARKPTYAMMDESGLSLTEMGGELSVREERFMSGWAERIPLFGSAIRASGRAYVGFLNKVRADVFEQWVKDAEIAGFNPKEDKDLTAGLAKFINAATGRGSLGSLERTARALNTFFFSPRLMASRLNLLYPPTYVKAHPFVRKKALKSLFAFSSAVGTALGLAALSGAKVEKDPRNADFGKIRIGNTRIDVMAGFQQYIKVAAQLASGKIVSSTTGKVFTLGKGYKPLTRYDILMRQLEYKESPIASLATSLLRGQTAFGEKVSIPKEIGKRFIPMVASDIYEIAKDDPKLLPLTPLGAFGFGLQTYGGKERKTRFKGR